MLPETKILGRGYLTPEAAFAPLRSALPWIRQAKGELAVPTSHLMFQQNEGRSKLCYQVKITADREGDRFNLVLQVERFGAGELLSWLGSAAAFLVAVGFFQSEALYFAGPAVAVISAIRFGYVWHHARLATAAFSLPYSEDKKTPAPLLET